VITAPNIVPRQRFFVAQRIVELNCEPTAFWISLLKLSIP